MLGAKRQHSHRVYMLTIRKHRVLEEVKFTHLFSLLQKFCRGANLHCMDWGIHNSGKYHQLHLHALVESKKKIQTNIVSLGRYACHISRVRNLPGAYRYIHREDKNTQPMRDQILAEVPYYYNYLIS